ncbi:MAG: SusC/RagA family TonB-linked outer membrane protein [Cytophagales bacterium]|nr:SusC/RagA family TonB-linked outer membrane protein [Cytophagales bacterium]
MGIKLFHGGLHGCVNSFALGLILSIVPLFHSKVEAQNQPASRKVKGVVYGLENNLALPLPGASISVTGESTGTVTDNDGKFVLTVPGEDIHKKELQISFIGMEPYTQRIGKLTEFAIYLEPSTTELDEIVVTSSYGTSRLKEEVVGSIAKVSTQDIAIEQPAVTFDELLEGQAAGVLVEVNPVLGGAASIDIRGQGSLTPLSANSLGTSTQPLIIIDGIILSEETGLEGNPFFDLGTGNLSEDILNPLAKVGVQDIESFSILKDAAAVGLYGADAANGVIIITTKQGKGGPIRFNASVQAGINTAFNRYESLSGEQYQQVLNEYYTNSGELNNVRDWNGVDTDWFNLLNRNGSFSRYNLSASGSVKNLRVRAGLGYQKTNEAQQENTFEKLNSSLKLNYGKGNFDVELFVAPSLVIKNSPNTLYAYAMRPTIPLYDNDGNYTFVETYGNPVAVSQQNKAEAKTMAVLSSLKLNYVISNSLSVSTLFGLDASYKDEDRFFSGLNGTGNFSDGTQGRRLVRDRDTRKWNWNGTLTYTPTLNGHHSFDALAGLELRGERVDFSYANGRGFDDFATPQPISLAEVQDEQSDHSTATARSFFAQANYDYGKRYFLLANFRVDQSSVFGGDNNTAINGGLGASWNISNERFLKSSNFVDFLSLRASYGRTGNSRIGTYAAVGLYDIGNTDFGYQSGSQNAGLNTSSPPNPNLGWEVNKKFNVGVDFHFLDKFQVTTEFFRDNIEDQIVTRDVIAESGYSTAKINGASMYNQGIEFSGRTNWFANEHFSWSSSFNFTRIENKVTSLSGLESDFSQASRARAQRVDFPTSTLWGFQFAGIDPATGRELFHVDGEIYDAAMLRDLFDETDWIPLGDTQPEFYGGFNNTFTYKKIRLNIICSYTYGGDVLVSRPLIDGYNDIEFRNPSVNVFYDAWYEQGDRASLPVVRKGNPLVSNSSKYVYDNSHIKLKSISLGYSLPVEKYKLPLKSLDISLNGSNLFYWFREKSPDNVNGIAELRNVYPEMRTYTLTINTTF